MTPGSRYARAIPRHAANLLATLVGGAGWLVNVGYAGALGALMPHRRFSVAFVLVALRYGQPAQQGGPPERAVSSGSGCSRAGRGRGVHPGGRSPSRRVSSQVDIVGAWCIDDA